MDLDVSWCCTSGIASKPWSKHARLTAPPLWVQGDKENSKNQEEQAASATTMTGHRCPSPRGSRLTATATENSRAAEGVRPPNPQVPTSRTASKGEHHSGSWRRRPPFALATARVRGLPKS